MIVELGLLALLLALATAAVTAIVPFIGAKRESRPLMAVGVSGTLVLFGLVAFSFAALTRSYIVSDFSVRNVWANSHSLMPLIYKFSGVWGNHEGSMMLWLLILTLFSALVAAFGKNLPAELRANVLSVQALIATAFLLFILLTSNPFERLFPAPGEGRDLNPILQDVGLAVHPPLLYLGYVGFSVCFSFAVAALISGKIDAAWARWVRPWTLLAWAFLTAGITMGSYWAYYELGWGGWWFWDPVENASFMPWLAGTALLHSALVMEKREALKIWTILLSILTFSLSLLGTFLVRSGVLTSVHAFATDPTRGVFILAILALFIGGSLALFAWRAPLLKAGGLFSPISREGALVFNNLVLTVATGTVLVGTLYPLLLETLTGDKISVGAPFFNLTFGVLMIPLLLAVPFGPMLSWKRGDLKAASERLMIAAFLALVCGGVFVYLHSGGPVLAVFGIALGFYLIFGALTDLRFRSGFGRVPFSKAWPRLKGLPRSAFGTALAHFGMGVCVLGVVAVSLYETETVLEMTPGMQVEAGGYQLTYEGQTSVRGANYVDDLGTFSVARDGASVGEVASAKRVYLADNTPTTEAGIMTFGLSQLYVSLGDESQSGAQIVRIWWKPFILCIWLGGVFMAVGGFVSLTDRRLRIGAPARNNKTSRVQRAAEAAG
ncbi:heme lyase CcmF/NrfE family subunit [Martelella mediterranea]|uniref:Cytochrome c-type biogenesis protein CcmF n=1 Tax=Martelella mediterranea TaxID=293089 RepID=A0A4R3NUH6_9HYPH|nr:heme lyase CcmF/NrfE family subunit [Martelella mediterranea]TCT40968.1 cytochrome c-type biogenesis protein CcmF [Martelella mediterranea]